MIWTLRKLLKMTMIKVWWTCSDDRCWLAVQVRWEKRPNRGRWETRGRWWCEWEWCRVHTYRRRSVAGDTRRRPSWQWLWWRLVTVVRTVVGRMTPVNVVPCRLQTAAVLTSDVAPVLATANDPANSVPPYSVLHLPYLASYYTLGCKTKYTAQPPTIILTLVVRYQ